MDKKNLAPDVEIKLKRQRLDYDTVEDVVNDIIKERFSLGEYLENLKGLHSPFDFKDMEVVVDKITRAVLANKNIYIWGDYDVDGTTSTYLAYSLLKKFVEIKGSSSEIGYYIAHREKEGYGPNNNGIQHLKDIGADLIITVDCGIASTVQVDYAHSIGLDIIVTDHHEYPDIPPSCPIINPHDGHYPYHNLSGCGVIFKTMEALYLYNKLERRVVFEYLDIAAISTVADLMPLNGENRLIVKFGLILLQNYLSKGTRPWLNKLLEKAKFKGEITSETIGFVIGPRINSVGRLDHSMKVLEFMLSEDVSFLDEYATFMNNLNEERKKLQEVIVKVGDELVQNNGPQNSINIVVEGRVGIVGLAASNLLEKYYRPTTVFSSSVSPDILKASARSIEGFNYYESVLQQNRDIIVGGGGHAAAAGLAIKKENIGIFNERVNKAVEDMLKKDPNLLVRKLHIDCELNPEDISIPLYNKIQQLAPFGMGNATPLFMLKNMTVKKVTGIPKKDPKHVSITLTNGAYTLEGMIFKRSDMIEELQTVGQIDVTFTLSVSSFYGPPKINLLINYFKPSILEDTAQ